ncbi:DUF2087 domain-containing protein [Vagococcus bubulae]|uniref:Transcriptional regulator n=1 Tax=Vagococcus bubulae TaxID=1977868 RepID=A0A429ZRC2_9ENTE|nr:DUF2087 domain-containing protein [Vagococcus bubulae]RST96246.1 transcriptional regulator [Vagococcus bubulae]
MTIERFFKDGKLTTIPRKTKDKRLLFEKLSDQFEQNTDYTEKEINNILKNYYDDFAILRRFLVDNDYLVRDDYGTIYRKQVKK